MPDTIVIDRSRFYSLNYNATCSQCNALCTQYPSVGKCCYIGQAYEQAVNAGKKTDYSAMDVLDWATNLMGYEDRGEMNYAAERHDEIEATKIFRKYGYEVEFIGEYP